MFQSRQLADFDWQGPGQPFASKSDPRDPSSLINGDAFTSAKVAVCLEVLPSRELRQATDCAEKSKESPKVTRGKVWFLFQ